MPAEDVAAQQHVAEENVVVVVVSPQLREGFRYGVLQAARDLFYLGFADLSTQTYGRQDPRGHAASHNVEWLQFRDGHAVAIERYGDNGQPQPCRQGDRPFVKTPHSAVPATAAFGKYDHGTPVHHGLTHGLRHGLRALAVGAEEAELTRHEAEERHAGHPSLDHEHQTAGLLDLQLPRVGVGGEACLPHDLEHMLLGLGPDIRPIIDDARNGADRTAADAGNVLDRHIACPRFRLDFRERCRERFQWL